MRITLLNKKPPKLGGFLLSPLTLIIGQFFQTQYFNIHINVRRRI